VAGREGLDIAFSDQGLERRRLASRSGLTKSLEPGNKPGNTSHVITRDEKRRIEGDERGRD
jgi:hypothetical protein